MDTSPISVLLPNYNHARFIGRQLNALLSQSVRPLEVIVIDDGSTDDSVKVIERFAKADPIVRLIRNERNLGVLATINRGLKECRGDYFTGVAADDVVAPGCFERIMRLIDRFPQAGIYFGKLQEMVPQDGGDGHIEGTIYQASRWTEELYACPASFLNDYLEAEPCNHSPSACTVYRKRYLEEVGGFRAELGHWCDTFAIRAIGLKYGACYTPSVQSNVYLFPDAYHKRQGRNVRLMLDIVGRAAWLMRSPEFRDRFPETHVARWERAYRDTVINWHLASIPWTNYLRLIRDSLVPRSADGMAAASERSGINVPLSSGAHAGMGAAPRRNAVSEWLKQRARSALFRLVLNYRRLRLRMYTPDLSCYSSAASGPPQLVPASRGTPPVEGRPVP